MSYKKLFDPTGLEDLLSPGARHGLRQDSAIGDRRDGKVYVYDAEGKIVLAVNVALATGRPLLLSGRSGGGKSSLAHHIARVLGRRYYEFVVTARTQAQDLTWRFDAVRRLADAQLEEQWRTIIHRSSAASSPEEEAAVREPIDGDSTICHEPKQSQSYLNSIYPYIEPQALWWVFDRASALRRGRPRMDPNDEPRDPRLWDLDEAKRKNEWTPENPQRDSCVLLIDEIDKADPDIPNNLLVELGSLQFTVNVISETVSFQGDREDWRTRPLVIITTNKERPLPLPFIRRCVVLELPDPKRQLVLDIAAKNFPNQDRAFFEDILDAIVDRPPPGMSGAANSGSGGAPTNPTGSDDSTPQPLSRENETVDVSIAEYLDTVRACIGLRQESEALNPALLADIIQKTRWTAKQEAVRP